MLHCGNTKYCNFTSSIVYTVVKDHMQIKHCNLKPKICADMVQLPSSHIIWENYFSLHQLQR
jgi:hypothetical protein